MDFTVEEIIQEDSPANRTGQESGQEDEQESLITDPTTVLVHKCEYRFTPWSQIDELVLVRGCIYDSIHIESNNDGNTDSLWNRKFTTDSDWRLLFAHERVCDWKIRCSNIPNHGGYPQQLILQHLITIESMINILLEEFKLVGRQTPERSNCSVLYNLYSIGVINFCNVLSSYSAENNFLSIKNLAKILQCPAWIVQCRHELSHPCSNPPSMQTLFNAITFGLRWMEKYFWNKFLLIELRKTPEEIPMDNMNLIESFKRTEINQIHHYCYVLMFLPRQRRPYMSKHLQQYMMHNPNSFVGIVARIMVFDVPKHIPEDNQNFLPGLLRRAARLLKIMFTVMPEHCLFLLLNLITDFVLNIQLKQRRSKMDFDDDGEDDERCIEIGYRWLLTILLAVTNPVKQTWFERSFSMFSNLDHLKHHHQFTWLRLFHRLLKSTFPKHESLFHIIQIIYKSFIVEDLFPEDKYFKIITLMKICLDNGQSYQNQQSKQTESEHISIANFKTINDLQAEIDYQMRLQQPYNPESPLLTPILSNKRIRLLATPTTPTNCNKSTITPTSNRTQNGKRPMEPYYEWDKIFIGANVVPSVFSDGGGQYQPKTVIEPDLESCEEVDDDEVENVEIVDEDSAPLAPPVAPSTPEKKKLTTEIVPVTEDDDDDENELIILSP